MCLLVFYFWCSNGILIDGLEPLLCWVKQSENSNKSKKPIQVIFSPIDLLVCNLYAIGLSFVLSQKRLALANVLFCFVEQCCQTKGRGHCTMQGYMILMMRKMRYFFFLATS